MQWACAESWIGVLKIIISSFLNSCGTDEKTMAKREATWTHLLSPRTCLSNTQFPTKSGWENKVFGSGKPRLQDVPSFHKWMDRSMRQMTSTKKCHVLENGENTLILTQKRQLTMICSPLPTLTAEEPEVQKAVIWPRVQGVAGPRQLSSKEHVPIMWENLG